MARMIPDQVPATATASEAEMFRLIRDGAGTDDWICLHSLGIARHSRKDYAETDFVVVGPGGVYCLEVKGGEVRRRDGVWEIGWPGKSYTSSEGPFRQAQGARWALLGYLEKRLGETRGDLVLGWGVAFPDVVFSETGPDWDQAVVFDQRDKNAPFGAYLKRLEQYFHARIVETGRRAPPRLSTDRARRISTLLRGDFDAVPSLTGLVLESERELVALTADQFRVLDVALHDRNPRILCDGGAGSGKTLLAREAALRLARLGRRVLFLCFNENLGYFLKLEASAGDAPFEVKTLYGFLGGIIKRGGFGPQLASERASRPAAELFEKAYPDLFESACDALLEENQLPQYDVLVIDEAQDLLAAHAMNCLELVLSGGLAAGSWLMCFDSGLQSSLYERSDDKVIGRLRTFGAVEFLLKENFRNPKGVVAEMCKVTGIAMPVCRRQLVSQVDYRVFSDERDQAKKLRALLVELLRTGIAPGQVTILSGTSLDNASFVRFPPDIGKRFELVGPEASKHSPDAFTIGTISGFKGLENDVIVLTDVPPQPDTEWTKALLYVGMTRARTKLYAFVGQQFIDARLLD